MESLVGQSRDFLFAASPVKVVKTLAIDFVDLMKDELELQVEFN